MQEQQEVDKFLETWATSFSEQIRNNLVAKDNKFDRSTLAQSIIALPIEKTDTGYVISITMNSYGEFVDEGRGATKNKSGSGAVRKGLAGASGWIAKYDGKSGFQLRMTRVEKYKKSNGSIGQRLIKYKNNIAANEAASFAISSKIHKYGYKSKGYGFWSEIVTDEILNDLGSQLILLTGEHYIGELIQE